MLFSFESNVSVEFIIRLQITYTFNFPFLVNEIETERIKFIYNYPIIKLNHSKNAFENDLYTET
jgi:hypothetical protein